MTEDQFHEVYGHEVAGNHTVLGVPSDGVGELCEWESDCGTRFLWVTNDDGMTFGSFLTRDEMQAELEATRRSHREMSYALQCDMHESGELDMDREGE
jgi:hypothetical protein